MSINIPSGYERLDDPKLRRWLRSHEALAERLGGMPEHWAVREVSDGNLNTVYVVTGPAGGVCVKQSLPHVRVVGESWPMPLERAYFEQLYFRASESHVVGLAPTLYHYDPDRFVLAMELLGEHVVLRRGLIEGKHYPTAAGRVAEYIARRAFSTSVLAEPFERVNDRIAAFASNHALTRITVDLIFTHPYIHNERNRWTQPYLDETVASLRADARLKAAVSQLGYRFMTAHEALLHGDLHTGSVMVSATDTRVIDAEFAIYGPIGFDLGLFIGNLLMAGFSQTGHETMAGERAEYREGILSMIGDFWQGFVTHFESQWCRQRSGDAWPDALISTSPDRQVFAEQRTRWLQSLFQDTVGYAGAEIVRRIVGFAHNADFESIEDPYRRATLERQALRFARQLILEPASFQTPDALIQRARECASSPQSL